MTNDKNWEIMNILVPPAYLAAIIKKVEDGVISNASAKILFNELANQRMTKLKALATKNEQTI